MWRRPSSCSRAAYSASIIRASAWQAWPFSFYGIAAFFALRAAATSALRAPRMRLAATGLALLVLSAAWHTRALATIEYARATARRSHMEWLVMLPERRIEFAERPAYLGIMNSMIEQGTDPDHTPACPLPRMGRAHHRSTMMSATHQLVRRRRMLASMMAGPALVAALGVCAVEAWRVLQPKSALFAAPFVFSLADAIERNDVDQAYAFIRAGQDPNAADRGASPRSQRGSTPSSSPPSSGRSPCNAGKCC